jgi:hypothetical protein
MAGEKYVVVEQGYQNQQVVFRTDDKAAADRVASQHAARRVIESKEQKKRG